MSKHEHIRKRFDEVFDLQMGKTPDRKTLSFFGGDNIWLSIKDMGAKYLKDSNEHITDEAVRVSGIKKVKKGTVVMSFKLTVGKCGIADVDLFTNEAIMAFNVKDGFNIKNDFLYYYLQGYKWQGANKAVMGLTLNKATISKQRISIPPMAEQEAIVAELDEINEAIAALQQQVADLDTLAQSTFYDMFGDPVTNPKAWPVKKLDESVQEMFLGPFGSALKVSSYVSESESFAMVYEQKHAIQGTINLDNHYINKEKFDSLARFEVKPKDFIMSCRGTIGRIFQLPDNAPKGIIHPSLMKIRIKNEVYDYSFFVVLLQKIIAEQTTKGNCVQMAITAKELGNMYFILPPLSLQQEFAAKVEAIESAKAELNAQIAEMQTLLASRMDYYFY